MAKKVKIIRFSSSDGSLLLSPSEIRDNKMVYNGVWCSLGTSITWYNDHLPAANTGLTKGYQDRVRETILFKGFQNKGIDGGTIVSCANYVDSVPVKADVYTVEYGINDWGAGTTIGTIEDYKNSTGSRTFYGAYRILIDKLYSLNLNAKIILCTPRKAYGFRGWLAPDYWYNDKNGLYLQNYVDAIIEIAKFESLPIADFFHLAGNQHTLVNESIDIALHPNDRGMSKMARVLTDTMISYL